MRTLNYLCEMDNRIGQLTLDRRMKQARRGVGMELNLREDKQEQRDGSIHERPRLPGVGANFFRHPSDSAGGTPELGIGVDSAPGSCSSGAERE